ncbi:MAG: hypothetical protein ABIP93_00490 [Gemmatimonadaceae bacterium]
MPYSRLSLHSILRPVLVGLQLLALAACEPVQPLLVENPQFSADGTRPLGYVSQYNVHFITITTTDSSLVTGQETQASGMARTESGQEVPEAPIAWSISPVEVATISPSGVITGGSTSGTATVFATSDGVTRSMQISVSATQSSPSAPPHMITITASASTIKVGEVAQVSGVVRDDRGDPVTGVPIVWSSSPTSVATTTTTNSTSATVTGQGVGSATIYARGDTVTRSITINVIAAESAPTQPPPSGPSGGSYGSATAAELPRVSVATGYPSMSRQVRVPAGGNLQWALDGAQPGDEILLAPGATYVGNFQLLNKGQNSGWIVIRTDLGDDAIGAPGTRMTPSRAASARLAKILTPTISAAVETMLGANHYRLTGVELGTTGAVGALNALLRFGTDFWEQNSTEKIASYLVLDRSYVHGSSSLHLTRCIALNSATTAIVDSWLADCHSNLNESQAIAGWTGPGPYLIQNNHLEGGQEVIVFGGGGVRIQNQSPSDITVRGNHIMRPVSWKGVWEAKNLIETKHVRRLLIEGNVIENNWVDAQAGFAFVIKSENQDNDSPWTQSADITIRYNKIRNTGNVFSLAEGPGYSQQVPAARIVIVDNVVENVNSSPFNGDGHTLMLLGGLTDIVMMHNTVVSANGGNSFAVVFGQLPEVRRLVIHSNVMHHGAYGMKGGGVGEGTASINLYAPGALVTNNAIMAGGSTSQYPATNYFPGLLSSLLSTIDYRLLGGSLYLGKGYDGRDIGADIGQVESMTRNAVVSP